MSHIDKSDLFKEIAKLGSENAALKEKNAQLAEELRFKKIEFAAHMMMAKTKLLRNKESVSWEDLDRAYPGLQKMIDSFRND